MCCFPNLISKRYFWKDHSQSMFIHQVSGKVCIFAGPAHIAAIFLASAPCGCLYLLPLEERAREIVTVVTSAFARVMNSTWRTVVFKAIPWYLWSVLIFWKSLAIMSIIRTGEGCFHSATACIFLHGDNLHIREDLLTIMCEVGAYFNRSTWVRKQMCVVAS